MKILLTTIFDIPHVGGLSTHVLTLKDGLESKGHTVDIFSFSDMNPFIKKAVAQAPGFLLNKWKKGKGQMLNDQNRGKLLTFYLKKIAHTYDVINAQDVIATLAALSTGKPTVATVHGYFAYEAISRGSIIKGSKEDIEIQRIEREAYRGASEVISVDKRIRDYIQKQANVNAHQIKNFINVNDFNPTAIDNKKLRAHYQVHEQANVLLVPRRLTEKNGVIYPVIALQKILHEFPNTLLLYAGTGEQLEVLRQKVDEFRLQNHVRFLGSVPHEKMIELYGIADVVLVPSIHSYGVEEATSISALEAMGSGSPVVASAVGGLKEIFDHQVDGWLVEEKNIDDLANAVVTLLTNRDIAIQLATRARDKVEKEYSHIVAAEKYANIYHKAMSK